MRHKKLILLAAVALLTLGVWFGNDLMRRVEGRSTSRSFGSGANGRLEDGMRLPSSGVNFETYSRLGSLIGRTYVDRRLHDTVLDAYAALAESTPETSFVYGETGWPGGGDFWPHRTHQNGLIVDFMTPLRRDGESVTRTAPWHGFGYALEFDDAGVDGDLSIDFEAMALHLDALRRAAEPHGLRIRKVIVAPPLRRKMLSTEAGRRVRDLSYSRTPVWVRHDDHYHVEFAPR